MQCQNICPIFCLEQMSETVRKYVSWSRATYKSTKKHMYIIYYYIMKNIHNTKIPDMNQTIIEKTNVISSPEGLYLSMMEGMPQHDSRLGVLRTPKHEQSSGSSRGTLTFDGSIFWATGIPKTVFPLPELVSPIRPLGRPVVPEV